MVDKTVAFWPTDAHPEGDEEFPRQRVLLDSLHAMKRLTDTLSMSHSLRPVFCSRLRDMLFCIDDTDVARIKKQLKEDRGMTDLQINELYRHRYRFFVSKSKRKILGPEVLLRNFDELIEIYSQDDADKNIGFCPDSGCYLFQKKRTVEAINNLRVHIQKGCLSELDEGGTAITPHATRFHIRNPMDSSKNDSAE